MSKKKVEATVRLLHSRKTGRRFGISVERSLLSTFLLLSLYTVVWLTFARHVISSFGNADRDRPVRSILSPL